jgi:MYXO-CTERM domain-containing protein
MLVGAGAALAVVLWSPRATADVATCSPVFAHEENATNLNWDTDWQPSGQSIQVRFTMSAKAGISASLPSKASLQRGGSLTYQGIQDQGQLKMGIWSGMTAKFRLQNLDFSGITINYEGNLPIPASWLNKVNNIIEDKASFTPLVLPGATTRPIKASLHSPKTTLFTLEYPVFTIGIASVTVKVPVALEAILNCDFQGDKVRTTPEGASQPVEHTTEGQAAPWPASASLTQKGSAVYIGDRKLSIVIKLYPSVQVKAEASILGVGKSKTWDVAEFELSWTALTDTQTWTFDPQALLFTFTAPLTEAGLPIPQGDATTGSDSGPASDGSRPASDGARPPTTGGATGGCCAVSGDGPLPPLAIGLALLAGLLVRRRRRS